MGLLGVGNDGLLYSDEKPVEVRRRLYLSGLEKAFATILGRATIFGGFGAVVQN